VSTTATPYFEACEALENIYLEDSYVLSAFEKNDLVSFEMEFVLTEQHELYHPPKQNERYCYKRGWLKFLSCSSVNMQLSNQLPSTDANGDKDLGNIDTFEQVAEKFFLQGCWGSLQTKCKKVIVDFDCRETNS
jgi:hypothetical protein